MEGIASTIEKATPRGETANDDQCGSVDSCGSIDQDDWCTARMGESLDALILVCPFFKLGTRSDLECFFLRMEEDRGGMNGGGQCGPL